MQITSHEFCFNQATLTKCIFKGMTNAQIARVMNVSNSSVSYYLNQLYEKYKAKNRNEFVISVLGQIIDNYKKIICEKNSKIIILENEKDELKNVVKNIATSLDNPMTFDYWIMEAKKYS